jgi:hypothetical protein
MNNLAGSHLPRLTTCGLGAATAKAEQKASQANATQSKILVGRGISEA